MLSDTLSEGLEAYRIGPKIRALRAAKGLALAQLGDHTGLSAGMLSKIERGQVVPTLPTLLRVALVFGVGLDHFFAPGEARPTLEIVRRADRLRLPIGRGDGVAYYFESLDYPVADRSGEAYLAEFPAQAPESAPHAHPGLEMVHVLSGCLALSIHGKTHLLEEGDTITFDAGFDHNYRAEGAQPCRALVALRAAAA